MNYNEITVTLCDMLRNGELRVPNISHQSLFVDFIKMYMKQIKNNKSEFKKIKDSFKMEINFFNDKVKDNISRNEKDYWITRLKAMKFIVNNYDINKKDDSEIDWEEVIFKIGG